MNRSIKRMGFFIVLLVAVVILPLAANAARISSGSSISYYSEKDDTEASGSIRLSEREATLDGDWYYVPTIINQKTGGMGAYVRANSVTVIVAEATATPDPNEAIIPTTGPSATTSITLAPGATPSPTPLAGAVNEYYTGTVISYTVPAGGLMLYDQPDGKGKQVESARVGTTLKLTLEQGGSWYSLYLNGKTYYVPDTAITLTAAAGNTVAPGSVRSIVVDAYESHNVDGRPGVYLYTKLNSNRTAVDFGSQTSNFFDEGERINIRYLTAANTNILVYTSGSNTYYIPGGAAKTGSGSSATVAEKAYTEMMSKISFTLAANGGTIKLYREQSTSASYYELTNTSGSNKEYSLYGVKVNDTWYQVMYGSSSEIFYVLALDLKDTGANIVDSAVNTEVSTDTFMVTIGANGGYYYRSIPAAVAGYSYPPPHHLPKVPAGGILQPGKTVLVSPYNATWYIYTVLNDDGSSTSYYLYRPNVADATSTSAVSAYKVTIYSNLHLYDTITSTSYARSAQLTGSPSGTTYVMQSVNDSWYSVVYNGVTYFVKKEDVQSATTTRIGKMTITVPAGSTDVLTLHQTDGSGPTTLAAGQSIDVYPIDTNRSPDKEYVEKWGSGYTYISANYKYFLIQSEIDAIDVKKVMDKRKVIEITIPEGSSLDKHMIAGGIESLPGPATIYVYKFDTNYEPDAAHQENFVDNQGYPPYAYISTDGTFLIADSDKTTISGWGIDIIDEEATMASIDRIANVSNNKTYYVTIGLGGAQLYTSAAMTTAAGRSLRGGEVVSAQKHTDTVYIIDGHYYLSVKDIASIRGGDDASAAVATIQEESIADVAQGEVDHSFQPVVLSYTTQSSGLWLYYDEALQRPALVLDAGKTIKLNGLPVGKDSAGYFLDGNGNILYKSIYSVWYGGTQYYVSRESLTTKLTDTAVGGSYSIMLDSDVELYKRYIPNPANKVTFLDQNSGRKLYAGARVNVTIQAYVNASTKAAVRVYRYVDTEGNIFFFYGQKTNGDPVNDPTETFAALVAAKADVSLVTKLLITSNTKIYTTADTNSGYYKETTATYLYGTKYNNDWYRVIYEDKVCFLYVGSGTDVAIDEQIVVTEGVSSTTYTVVIGTGGAKLYTKPTTNAAKQTINGVIYEIGDVNNSGMTLTAGSTVLASKVANNSSWYACVQQYNGTTLYFQNNTATVSNQNTNASISSYIVTFPSDMGYTITLYASISADDPSKTNLSLKPGETHTLRKINSTWSSVYYNGKTYYLKNSQIPTLALQQSKAIATTSVGNTYIVTLSNPSGNVNVYTSNTLETVKTTLPSGTKTSGVKEYVKGAIVGKQLVFNITYHNGADGYVNALDVAGVQEGNEVAEAKLAEQEANLSGSIAVGQTVQHRIETDELLYEKMDLSSTTTPNLFSQVYELTKMDGSWYSVTFFGDTWYYPAANVSAEKSETGGTQVTVSVGESYNYTFKKNTSVYNGTSESSRVVDTISAGITLSIYRISENYYQIEVYGDKYYILASDVSLPFIPNTSTPTPGTTTELQHDGVGYITSYLVVTASSGSVNLRKSASISSTVLERIPYGVQVKNNGYAVDASNEVWYSVTYNNRSGFVHGDYVSPVGTATNSSSGDPANDIGRSLIVNVSEVNVRSGPGTNYSVTAKLPKGQTVVPLSYETGTDGMVWYQFQLTMTQKAWIRYDYLDGSAATSEQSGNVAIKAGGTNLRSGPGESFGVVARLARDIIVTIIGTGTDSLDNTWYYVTYEGTAGYLRYDLVRPLTESERSGLQQSVIDQYFELKSGSKGAEVLALQQQLIKLGYLASGNDDGIYGSKTIDAVKAFQKAKGMTQTGVATASVQAALYNTPQTVSGATKPLDWFSTGVTLIAANKNITVYDINVGISWNATYINGANHADVIPASKADADKIKAYNITGSWVRRPVIVTIGGQNYAGSMYAVGHGDTSYCTYYHGVLCIHFTGSKTHGTGNVDKDHQSAIQTALTYGNSQ